MDAIRKQASKLREQVAKQQQAVLKRLASLANDASAVDEAELLCHQQLQSLYNSTRLAKVCKPLRAQINGAPLEDARQLAHNYDRVRHDVELQVAEVMRRRTKSRTPSIFEESSTKLQTGEARLTELKSSIKALGQEAIAAMLSVEDQQQQATFFRLLTMVNTERSYHQHALVILEGLQAEMILEKQPKEFSPVPVKEKRDIYTGVRWQDNKSIICDGHIHVSCDDELFIAKVIHQFDARAEGELNLSLDDYVVVRQVAPNGWSKGECMSKAGWFPSAYVERQETAPADKIM